MEPRQISREDVACRLRRIRTEQGLSRPDLAARFTEQGLATASETQLYRWESGESLPSLERLHDLCVVLKTTPNDLLGFDTEAAA